MDFQPSVPGTSNSNSSKPEILKPQILVQSSSNSQTSKPEFSSSQLSKPRISNYQIFKPGTLTSEGTVTKYEVIYLKSF